MAESELSPIAIEQRDVPTWVVALFGAIILGTLLGVIVALPWFFPGITPNRQLPDNLEATAEPRLQASPRAAMDAFRAEQQDVLSRYGWIDRAHGVARIPIERAIELTAHDGIADWPAAGVKR